MKDQFIYEHKMEDLKLKLKLLSVLSKHMRPQSEKTHGIYKVCDSQQYTQNLATIESVWTRLD